MQSFILFIASTLLGISTFAPTNNDTILGQWTNEDNSRVLEFVKNGSEYEAIVRKAELPAYIGKKQITSLKYDKKNAYVDGTLHIF